MSKEQPNKEISSDIPSQIFEKFLTELKSIDVPPELIDHLGSIILKKDVLSETEINTALFSSEQSI